MTGFEQDARRDQARKGVLNAGKLGPCICLRGLGRVALGGGQ